MLARICYIKGVTFQERNKMNNEDNYHMDEWMQEEILMRDYFLRKSHPVPNVQEELKSFMQHIDVKEKNHFHTSTKLISVVLAIAASLALIFLLHWGKEKRDLEVPAGAVVAYKADGGQQVSSVSLQTGDDDPVSISVNQQNCAKIDASVVTNPTRVSSAIEVVRNVLTTPSNVTAEVTLEDGSVVTLNAGSRLVYPQKFQGSRREVELQGEAYFKVKHDASHPFVVRANGISTKVLGTEFNVRSFSKQDTHVTLLQGSVLVSYASASKKLIPGEDATIQGGKMTVHSVDTEVYTAWKNGEFYFDNETLLDIAKEIGKWYNVSVIFQSPEKMHARLFFAAPRDADIEELLDLLNGLDKAKFSYHNGQVTIE